jgi:prepilin-type N-terminal cleavage/methylation domain-containing protein
MAMPNEFKTSSIWRARRGGFTLLELAIVLSIAGVIASFAVPSYQNIKRSMAAQNARDAFVWMASRARASAVERGTTYMLELDPAADRAWIVLRRVGSPAEAQDTLQKVDYPSEFGATVSTAANTRVTLCYNPRGYAWRCNTSYSPSTNVDITFTQGATSAAARAKVLGQVERL